MPSYPMVRNSGKKKSNLTFLLHLPHSDYSMDNSASPHQMLLQGYTACYNVICLSKKKKAM